MDLLLRVFYPKHLTSMLILFAQIVDDAFRLFLADRAKSIKTKAVVNESPTEKLIRELREENQRLLDQLKTAGQPIVVPGEPGEPQMVGISEEGKVLRRIQFSIKVMLHEPIFKATLLR